MSGFFEVKLTRSPIGYDKRQREVLKGMGLRKMGSTKLLKDTHQNRGMIFKMSHLVQVKGFKTEAEYKKYVDAQRALFEKPVKILSSPKSASKQEPKKSPEPKRAKPTARKAAPKKASTKKPSRSKSDSAPKKRTKAKSATKTKKQ